MSSLSILLLIPIIILILITRGIFFYINFKKLSKKEKKNTFIFITVCIIIFICYFTLLNIFPNEKCKIILEINNKTAEAEIRIINKPNYELYNLQENEKIIYDYNREYIAINTNNNAKIFLLSDNKHIFTFSHKVKINITDKDINIRSWFVSSGTLTNNRRIYDAFLEEILLK